MYTFHPASANVNANILYNYGTFVETKELMLVYYC